MKSKPCMLKVSIYRLRQSQGALFQQCKSCLQLMAKSWPHEQNQQLPILHFHWSQDLIRNDRVLILFTRDEAVHTVTQAIPSTVWCHLLSCGALIRKLWDEGKMVLHLTAEKVKVKQQDNKCWHDASVLYDIFHLHNLFIQVVCSWIDFLVTFLPPSDLAPLVQPCHWSGCSTRGVRVQGHHAQVDCHAPPMTGPQKRSFNLLTRLRVIWLCASETRGYKRNSKCFNLESKHLQGPTRHDLGWISHRQ